MVLLVFILNWEKVNEHKIWKGLKIIKLTMANRKEF